MPVVDAHVRVHHPCPYCDLSVRFPGTLMLLWCDNRRDTFLLSSTEPEELADAVRALRRSFHAKVLLAEGDGALLEVPDFEWSEPPSVTRLAREGGVWVLPPVVYAEGRETYRFLAPTRAHLHRLIARVRRLGEVEILSVSDRSGLEGVRDFPTASVHFFEGLSPRQARALVSAHDAGLLEIPARSNWEAVARREGLSRSTFGEHLRKAQLRLVRNSLAILRSRASVPAGPPIVLPALGPARTSGEGPAIGSPGRPAARSSRRRAGSARRT
jgi:predicted DNA binding protein